MNGQHLEKIFYKYLLANKNLLDMVSDRFFTIPELKTIYGVSKKYIEKYNSVPSDSQIYEICKSENIDITREQLNIFVDAKIDEYDTAWLTENIYAWIEYKNLDTSVKDLIMYLKNTNINIENIKDVVQVSKDIIYTRNNLQFEFDEGLDFFNPESHIQPTHDCFSSGYNYIDLCGGFNTKTLVCLLGSPKIGKSIWLCNLSANSVKQGNNTAVISFEMKDRKLIKRIGANMLNVSVKEYDNFSNNQLRVKDVIANLNIEAAFNPFGKLYVKEFPTSAMGVPDIELYLKKIEDIKGIKFKVVFIDYINIIKNHRNPNTENTYMKIKQIAEDLRAMAIRNNWCIVTATQTNKDAFDVTDLNIANVAESIGLIQTVDQLYGIIQDELMHTNREYILKCLANRDEGYKNSRKKFLINYDYMRITEDSSQIQH